MASIFWLLMRAKNPWYLFALLIASGITEALVPRLGVEGGSEIFLVLLFMIGNTFAAFQLIPQHNQLKIKVLLILGGLVDVEEIMDIDSSLIRDDIILIGTHLLIVPEVSTVW